MLKVFYKIFRENFVTNSCVSVVSAFRTCATKGENEWVALILWNLITVENKNNVTESHEINLGEKAWGCKLKVDYIHKIKFLTVLVDAAKTALME